MNIKPLIYITKCTDPHKNLAAEELLQRTIPHDAALLFLWQNSNTVVIGAGQNAWRECNISAMKEDTVTLARRSSGGGAVFHDTGNLNFSFIMPCGIYNLERQLSVVLNAVKQHGIDAAFSGRNDITADGRKFSGNAFRNLPTANLHHGTLLIDVDMTKMGKYLNPSKAKLTAKGVKSVPSRVVNLNTLREVTIDSMQDAMITAFQSEYGTATIAVLDDLPGLHALTEQYASWQWNYGASPSFDCQLETRFEWGELVLGFQLKCGIVESINVYTDAMDETLANKLSVALTGAKFDNITLSECARKIGQVDVAAWLKDLEL